MQTIRPSPRQSPELLGLISTSKLASSSSPTFPPTISRPSHTNATLEFLVAEITKISNKIFQLTTLTDSIAAQFDIINKRQKVTDNTIKAVAESYDIITNVLAVHTQKHQSTDFTTSTTKLKAFKILPPTTQTYKWTALQACSLKVLHMAGRDAGAFLPSIVDENERDYDLLHDTWTTEIEVIEPVVDPEIEKDRIRVEKRKR